MQKDFVEEDVERFKEGNAYQRIRLKPGSLPRTDKATRYMVDPTLASAKRDRSVRVVAEAPSNRPYQHTQNCIITMERLLKTSQHGVSVKTVPNLDFT